MRWFAAALLLFNLLVYYWFDRQSSVIAVEVDSIGGDQAASLVLVSELSEVERETRAIDALSGTDSSPSCWILGPLDQASIERLSAEMDAAGLSVTARSDIDMDVQGYWVYLPAQATEAAREVTTNALKEDGIDYFVFSNGKLVNGISLGFFNQLDNAEQKQRELADVGYSTEIVSAPSLGESFWVSMPGLTFDSLSAAFWQDMGKLSPAMTVLTTECARA